MSYAYIQSFCVTDMPKGHSLGASYASLFYAELMRFYNDGPISRLKQPACLLRDLYIFGSPRFGLADFADIFSLAIDEHAGYSWRIICHGDPVGLVPPVLITDPKFIHLDKGYEVFDTDGPVELQSEKNSHPRPPLPVVTINMSNHSESSQHPSKTRLTTYTCQLLGRTLMHSTTPRRIPRNSGMEAERLM